ncbi:MAG: response regulator [Deltaproteobacteria bacterium]|nr:response regulator [Deltaproteobacteria bacterium]
MKKLLILEDNKETRLLYEIMLKEFELRITPSAEEALSIVEKEGADAAILDVRTSDKTMDGITLAHLIESRGMNIPIIFITAYDKNELSPCNRMRLKYIKNLKQYNVKPVTPKELRKKIAAITA